jgi:hypothetical protein
VEPALSVDRDTERAADGPHPVGEVVQAAPGAMAQVRVLPGAVVGHLKPDPALLLGQEDLAPTGAAVP